MAIKQTLTSAYGTGLTSKQKKAVNFTYTDPLIFGSTEEGRGFHMNVDHDHKTGKVRGLLCNGCNRGLGLLKEENLLSAIQYLEQAKQLA